MPDGLKMFRSVAGVENPNKYWGRAARSCPDLIQGLGKMRSAHNRIVRLTAGARAWETTVRVTYDDRDQGGLGDAPFYRGSYVDGTNTRVRDSFRLPVSTWMALARAGHAADSTTAIDTVALEALSSVIEYFTELYGGTTVEMRGRPTSAWRTVTGAA